MKKSHLWIVLLICIAIFSRFFNITNKPLHYDEAINGWFVLQMKQQGAYHYDPNNYHGPLYFYLLQFFEFLFGSSVQTLRAVPALFSCLSVLLFLTQPWMAFFLLLSPAMLFFGRSGIHEMPFVFFQLVFALGLFRWLEKADREALILGLVGLWGMSTLKETFVINLIGWMLALISLGPTVLKQSFSLEKFKKLWDEVVLVVILVLLIAFIFLFTEGFRRPAGLFDFFRAFLPWLKTGVHGQGHEKEFLYWVKVLFVGEPLVLVGAGIAFFGIFSTRPLFRALSVFALSQLLIYSLIPYKTVWCILAITWGFYAVLALFLSEASTSLRRGVLLIGVVPAVLGLKSAYESVYREPLQMDHPFFYVNGTYDLKYLSEFLLSEAQKKSDISHQQIQIGTQEQWPWPWVLRSFSGLRYDLCKNRIIENALIYICEQQDRIAVEGELLEPYWRVEFLPRQSRDFVYLYLKKSWFPEIPFASKATLVDPTSEVK